MKILVLADGSSSHISRYVTELHNQGADVFLASFQKGSAVDYLMPHRNSSEWRMYFSACKNIGSLIEEHDPDIVNAHFASAYGYSAARCRKKCGAQNASWVLTVWGSDILISPRKSVLHKARVKSALRGADIVLADSNYLAGEARSIESCETRVIPWGIESSEVADDERLRARAEWPHQQLRILAPRPHRDPYNNKTLVATLAPLLKQGLAVLVTSMEGDVDGFKQLCDTEGVSGAVEFYERSSRADYLERLAESHILISASLSDSSPVSVIEALAVGTIPLVGDIPGVRDIIPESLSGAFLYSLDSDGELLDNVNELCGMSADERLRLLQAGRDHIARVAIYETNISETLGCFEALVGRSA